MKSDEEIIQMAKEEPHNVRATAASMLYGAIAFAPSGVMRTAMPLGMATIGHCSHRRRDGDATTNTEHIILRLKLRWPDVALWHHLHHCHYGHNGGEVYQQAVLLETSSCTTSWCLCTRSSLPRSRWKMIRWKWISCKRLRRFTFAKSPSSQIASLSWKNGTTLFNTRKGW